MGDLLAVRSVQARVFALQGRSGSILPELDWLESTARESDEPQVIVLGLGAAALARAELGEDRAATALLAEVQAFPGARDDPVHPMFLPSMVRTALSLGDPALAEDLVRGHEPRYPHAEHAMVAASAAVAEAQGDLQAAVEGYIDAADRWERFGVVPEHAFALLGQGRCLNGLGSPGEAIAVLDRAREIFERLGAIPALAETDALLEHRQTEH